MDIITCPHCRMRVLPKSDGTCPSCHSNILEKKRKEISKFRISRSEANKTGILKLIGFAWYMYCLSFLVGIIFIVVNAENDIIWPWWPGIVGAILSLLMTLVFLYYGLYQRRAYKIYVLLSLLTSFWTVPLLASGFQLASSRLIIILVIIGSCSISFLLSYKLNFQKLATGIANRTAAINMSRGTWDVNKPLDTNDAQKRNASLAQLLVPLGVGIGAILSRSFPAQGRPISCIIVFVMAYAMASYPGKQLATAQYLRGLEKELDKPIKI